MYLLVLAIGTCFWHASPHIKPIIAKTPTGWRPLSPTFLVAAFYCSLFDGRNAISMFRIILFYHVGCRCPIENGLRFAYYILKCISVIKWTVIVTQFHYVYCYRFNWYIAMPPASIIGVIRLIHSSCNIAVAPLLTWINFNTSMDM